MEPVIQPVDRKLIIKELTKEKFIRVTRKGRNYLYEVTAKDSPNVMQEIGRLREISFRLAGGGTGKPVDIELAERMSYYELRVGIGSLVFVYTIVKFYDPVEVITDIGIYRPVEILV